MARGFAVLLILVLVASTGALPRDGAADATAAARCEAGQVTWKVAGRDRCVPRRSVAPPQVARPASAAALETALAEATRPAKLNRRRQPPARLRRALARVAPRAVTTASALEGPLLQRQVLRRAQATGPGSDGLTRTFSESRGGLDVTAKATGRPDAAGGGSVTLDISLTDRASGTTLTVEMGMPVRRGPASPCPDRSGRVQVERSSSGKLTSIGRKGGRVISARTIEVRDTSTTVAEVGPDGAIQSTATTVTQQVGVYERGVSVDQTTTVTVGGPVDAAAGITGTPTATAKVRAAESSPAEERAMARQIAESAAADKGISRRAGDDVKRDRDELATAAQRWNDINSNPCVKVVWSPPAGGPLEQGQTTSVVARLVRKDDGAPVAATWEVEGVVYGSFTGGGPAGPDGATFTAVAGPRQATGDTVVGRVIARSSSGSVLDVWTATGADLPATIDGTMKQTMKMTQGGATLTTTFTATARWTRSEVTANPDGSRTAWFKVAGASTSQFSHAHDVNGCGYAVENSGGTPVSGDVELRIAADGAVTYGFVVDIRLEPKQLHKTHGPPSCPPDGGSPQMDAIVQARRAPDSSLYAAPPGALSGAGFSVSRQGVTDSVATTGGIAEVTVDWTLTGS